MTHGLTGRTVLLPSEDPAAHQRHTQDFFDEYKPQGPTERQLVQELVDTSWRINRVPALEAEALSVAQVSDCLRPAKSRDIQAERRETETRDLKRAAALLEMHKVKGIPYDPAQDGFVFSSDQIETFSLRLIRLHESRHIEHIRFYAPLTRPASI